MMDIVISGAEEMEMETGMAKRMGLSSQNVPGVIGTYVSLYPNDHMGPFPIINDHSV